MYGLWYNKNKYNIEFNLLFNELLNSYSKKIKGIVIKGNNNDKEKNRGNCNYFIYIINNC